MSKKITGPAAVSAGNAAAESAAAAGNVAAAGVLQPEKPDTGALQTEKAGRPDSGAAMTEIQAGLFALQDLKYRDFHSKLMPNVDKERIIGVRTPALRDFAKKLYKSDPEGARAFLESLPHRYYEENNLHGALIGLAARKPEDALDLIDRFLPYVDNWATCDMLPPKCFKKNLPLVRARILPWLDSPEEYRVRFAVVCMLNYFLEEGFEAEDLMRLAAIHRSEYYINMAIAWYYSFALIKQYEAAIGLFESKTLDVWIHNKSIQKACESYRVDEEKKTYLRSLRIKKKTADAMEDDAATL